MAFSSAVSSSNNLISRLIDVVARTYDLGFTAFGGPPVHFQIQHRRFVDSTRKAPWIDEQTYQELFAICQALPGPGSTKMIFSIAFVHAGLLPAALVFFLWSLPGALGMYGLAVGVQRIKETLPHPVYALLSGLNSATVGIIALAAVQLARKAITDKLTRLLVLGGACAGLLYNALWYFPVLMVIGGLATLLWDCWAKDRLQELKLRRSDRGTTIEEGGNAVEMAEESNTTGARRRATTSGASLEAEEEQAVVHPSELQHHAIPVKWGIAVIVAFFVIFITLMVIRGVLDKVPLPLALFNNMYLAGTIIFGGGPVVIPLLREYVVEPGWVSPRDFLLGLALIQAFPGPNFNFAVYLGGLTLRRMSTALGSVLGYIGIFLPGITLQIGFQSIWKALRKRREVVSVLRGIHASAVGLVFTAVYRLWEIGFLTPERSAGVSLGNDPWWLAVSASTFTAVEWYGVPPAAAIIAGGVAGLAWWGAVKPWK